MSKNVDQRVVEMKFDNKQFEGNVQNSIKSLDALKKGLNLDESSKSLSNLGNTAKGFTLGHISDGIETVKVSFSALGVMGVAALTNITNSAVNAGKQLIKSLTIDPISDGFADYNRKLNSVQTIMNATGVDIKTVSGYFSQLDTYADKTIYNLDDMTSAFAKFTNAGVDMGDSVPAIKGIANMVAVAGQDANAAQIAFYNLSQSIAGGFLTTTDYKSLNLANVATKEWKAEMIKGAIAAGTLKETSKGMYIINGAKNATSEAALFNEELSKGWATTAVMLDVFGKYGDETTDIGKKSLSAAQDIKSFSMMMDTLKASVGTGWTETFELLVGNLEESKALLTPITNVIGGFIDNISNARNDMLEFWKANGGRDLTIQALSNAFKTLISVIKPVTQAFREVFPAMTGERLLDITKSLKAMTDRFKIGEEELNNITTSFKGLFSAMDIGVKILGLIAGGFIKIVDSFLSLIKPLLSATALFGQFITGVNDAIIPLGVMDHILDRVKQAISTFANALNTAIQGKTSFVTGVANTIDEMTNMEDQTYRLTDAFDKLIDIFKALAGHVGKVAKVVGNTLGPVLSFIFDKIKDITLMDLGTAFIGSGLLTLSKSFSKSIGSIDDLLDNFSNIIGQVGNTLEAFQLKVKADALIKIAIAVGILAVSLVALSTIDGEDVVKSLVMLTVVIGELILSLVAIDKFVKGAPKLMGTIIGFSIGIAILASAVKILSTIDPERVNQSVLSLGAIMAMLGLFMKATQGMKLKSSGLITLAIGITILAEALTILSKIPWQGLVSGELAIAGLLTMITAFIYATKGNSLQKSSAGLISFALGLTIMAGAVTILAKLDKGELTQGVVAITALMVVLAGFVALTSKGNLNKSSAGLISFALGLTIMAGAVTILGNLDKDKTVQGVVAISAIMGAIVIFVNATKGTNLNKNSVGLILFAGAISILAGALVKMGELDAGQLAKSVIAIGALLTVIAGFAMLSSGGDLIATGVGLGLMSAALFGLAVTLSMIAALELNEILRAIGAIATVFVVLGVASAVLAPLTPTLLALSLAVAAFGLACLLIGAAINSFADGLDKLAVSGKDGAKVLAEAILDIIYIIPAILVVLAEGIIEFAKTIGDGAPDVAIAFIKILDAIINTINISLPKLIECGAKAILAVLKGISDNIGSLVKIGVDIILNFIKGISSKIPDIIDTAFKVIIDFINGLSKAIDNNHMALYEACRKLINSIINAIIDFIPQMIGVGKDMMRGFIKGIASMGSELVQSAKNVASKAVQGVKNFLDINSPSRVFEEIGKYSVEGLAVGLDKYSYMASDCAVGVGSNMVDSLKDAISNVSDIITSDADFNPTITPVLDLSNVTAGGKTISDLLSQDSNLNMSSTTSKLPSVSTVVSNQDLVTKAINDMSDKFATELLNTVNSPNGGPYEIIVPVTLEGREVARVTAPYMNKELATVVKKGM